MMEENVRTWMLSDLEFEERERLEIEEAMDNIVNLDLSYVKTGENYVTAEYENGIDYAKITVTKKVNQYNVAVYIVEYKSFSFHNEILTCECDTCTDDCPLFGLSSEKITEQIQNEIKDYENKSAYRINTWGLYLQIRPRVIEYYGRLFKGTEIKAYTTNFANLLAVIRLLDKFENLHTF